MRHDVHDYLYFDDHDGQVHTEEADSILTVARHPVVVAEKLRHRHIDPDWMRSPDILDLGSLWITQQINKDRVVLIRAPRKIEYGAIFAAATLLDAGLGLDEALDLVTPPTVILPQWMRDLLS